MKNKLTGGLFLLTCGLFFVSHQVSFCIGKEKSTTESLTPAPKPSPRINGPLVYGCRPGHPFLYRIPCQGERPISFSVKGLPKELKLDHLSGIISGSVPSKGEYQLVIEAINSKGKDQRSFRIISGEKLALTPPMGYNHWYAHYNRITDPMMREAADVMISSGMADVGYQFVNIDDCWMNSPKNSDPKRVGPLRDAAGNIIPNSYFPDMKGLADYIHAKGLKAGIYTSPGPLTCGGFTGAWQHEEQDARQFTAWGFDFLKYDWCSYGERENSVEAFQKPYIQMGSILKNMDRDIVFNLCQYGMGEVWKWGGAVGGNCWRTADDLGYELDRIFDVALKNCEHRLYSKPGEWNDPDYIQIGWIGSADKQGIPELTPMPAAMQYAYMSMWSLMAAPLIYSGDMSKLDDFTLNVLCNPEVIEVNQDPLGECALVIKKTDSCFLMVKNLADGSRAVGLFNRGKGTAEVQVDWSDLQLTENQMVRDLWRQRDLGEFSRKFSARVPSQGVVLVRLTSVSKDTGLKLMGNRFFTLSTVVRVNQIEVSRDKNDGVDESGIHTPEGARKFRETIAKCWPGARITWTFSWLALKDQRPNYLDIKKLVVSYHEKYGDEITFLPGGYFANMYNSREQVNRDLHEGLQMVSEMVGGGYRPKSVVAGFLSAENQRYLAEVEGIHVCQGNIWSQYAVDNGDGEGSISYPYYPSREHFCKPAQGKEDMIDCVNLDGWTVDFLNARYPVPRFINGIRCGSRQGVGPIETILRQGTELGTKEILATTAAHFDTGFALNKFAWVTCIWEMGLVDLEQRDRNSRNGLDGLEIWLNEMRSRWPEAKCITHGEFGMLWREQFKNNDSINYRFVMRGSGVCGSEPEMEIRWFMNKDFRLALLRNWQENTPEKLIDFTRYDLKAQEPGDPKPGESSRNWSLMNRLNQKGTRQQDQPIDISQLNPEEQQMIKRRYPDLISGKTEK